MCTHKDYYIKMLSLFHNSDAIEAVRYASPWQGRCEYRACPTTTYLDVTCIFKCELLCEDCLLFLLLEAWFIKLTRWTLAHVFKMSSTFQVGIVIHNSNLLLLVYYRVLVSVVWHNLWTCTLVCVYHGRSELV